MVSKNYVMFLLVVQDVSFMTSTAWDAAYADDNGSLSLLQTHFHRRPSGVGSSDPLCRQFPFGQPVPLRLYDLIPSPHERLTHGQVAHTNGPCGVEADMPPRQALPTVERPLSWSSAPFTWTYKAFAQFDTHFMLP